MMNLVKWNPWREMPTMHNRINRLFDDPFFRIERLADEAAAWGTKTAWACGIRLLISMKKMITS